MIVHRGASSPNGGPFVPRFRDLFHAVTVLCLNITPSINHHTSPYPLSLSSYRDDPTRSQGRIRSFLMVVSTGVVPVDVVASSPFFESNRQYASTIKDSIRVVNYYGAKADFLPSLLMVPYSKPIFGKSAKSSSSSFFRPCLLLLLLERFAFALCLCSFFPSVLSPSNLRPNYTSSSHSKEENRLLFLFTPSGAGRVREKEREREEIPRSEEEEERVDGKQSPFYGYPTPSSSSLLLCRASLSHLTEEPAGGKRRREGGYRKKREERRSFHPIFRDKSSSGLVLHLLHYCKSTVHLQKGIPQRTCTCFLYNSACVGKWGASWSDFSIRGKEGTQENKRKKATSCNAEDGLTPFQ